MHLNYLALAVPVFTILMYVEYYLSRRKGQADEFQFSESVANINVGIAERLSDLFVAGVFYFFFSFLYRQFAVFDISPGFLTWLLLFLLTDFAWYWYHRFGHEVNLFWSVHVVHHQSEDYNFTVSARITVLQALARCLFWAILPLIGFPPQMIMILLLVHGAYPFFTHTQLVGKLGWLEYFLVTPSHHRVHHSSNPRYLDKNYGDVLIIWDKIFGTFAKEDEKPVYGLTKPLGSHSFLWQHFHFMLEMLVAFKRARGVRAKWRVIFGSPDDIDPGIRAALERKLSFRQQNLTYSKALLGYITCQTVITLILLFLTILFEYYLTGNKLFAVSVFILLSVINTGSMLEQRKWIFHLEFARAIVAGSLAWLYFPAFNFAIIMICMGMAILLFYKTIGEKYYSYLYEK